MKKILLVLTSILIAATYDVKTVENVGAYQREGIMLECDSNASSAILNIRGMSTVQLSVSGIDSTEVIVYWYVGGIDFLSYNNKIGITDTSKVRFAVDTIEADGIFSYTYIGTGVGVETTKLDSLVKIRFNFSTYQ